MLARLTAAYSPSIPTSSSLRALSYDVPHLLPALVTYFRWLLPHLLCSALLRSVAHVSSKELLASSVLWSGWLAELIASF
jgi:hypothetical protein